MRGSRFAGHGKRRRMLGRQITGDKKRHIVRRTTRLSSGTQESARRRNPPRAPCPRWASCNGLQIHTTRCAKKNWAVQDSNLRLLPCEGSTLATELTAPMAAFLSHQPQPMVRAAVACTFLAVARSTDKHPRRTSETTGNVPAPDSGIYRRLDRDGPNTPGSEAVRRPVSLCAVPADRTAGSARRFRRPGLRPTAHNACATPLARHRVFHRRSPIFFSTRRRKRALSITHRRCVPRAMISYGSRASRRNSTSLPFA